MELPAENKRYTFADVLTWDESERIEIINGEAFMMAPPSRVHQEISVAIAAQLYNYLEGKRCKVYPAPFGVRLFEQDGARPEDVDTMVEPDISVVCDSDKLDDHGCKGAPDLIIEILSPSTQRHDRLVKLGLYQRAGVREYWTVNPEDKTVQVMLRDDYGVLQLHEVYGRDGVAKVNVLNGCFIELVRVFPE
ncbi:MAG: Uma2 family endonuclease [Lawsonibacter sp.]|jgi:Uma2 family endonuclease|uniref:Uma2 family endonuclease n=1 Tax=Lawsonibacter sp. JLR.KK007 TaxID=3114293 RepID=UPI00217018C5|nr:Uma2 family endonuclease [Lawsonibacter sp.]MCI8990013.1 Uma2 family endonuclease [Lawsonibacter sp.]